MSPQRRGGLTDGRVADQGPRLSGVPRPGAAERKAEALRAAARSRHADALARADKGLRQIIKIGGEVNFRAVARAGSVSLNFLYEQRDLRTRIEHLRAQQRSTPASRQRPGQPDPSASSNVVRALAAQLKEERAHHLQQVRDLEERLAAAHAEILRLTRALASRPGTDHP
jgi:hypothetical protein